VICSADAEGMRCARARAACAPAVYVRPTPMLCLCVCVRVCVRVCAREQNRGQPPGHHERTAGNVGSIQPGRRPTSAPKHCSERQGQRGSAPTKPVGEFKLLGRRRKGFSPGHGEAGTDTCGSAAHCCAPTDLLGAQNGDFLQYASAKMRRDPEVVMAAVQNKGYAMKYAGAELVEDPSFMMKIVMECSRTYKYAGIKAYEFSPLGMGPACPYRCLCISPGMKREALFAIVYLPSTRGDWKLGREVEWREGGRGGGTCTGRHADRLTCRGDTEYAQSNIRKNKAIVAEAVARQPFSLCFADNDLRDDAEFVAECVSKNGLALEYASKRLKMNMMIVETAIKQNPNALPYAAPDVRNDPGIVGMVNGMLARGDRRKDKGS